MSDSAKPSPAPPGPKPGAKTSEFWLTIGTSVVGGLLTAGVLGTGPVAVAVGGVLMALSALGYGHSRAVVKAAHAK